jgi:uncharacterized protein (DUF885 family)
MRKALPASLLLLAACGGSAKPLAECGTPPLQPFALADEARAGVDSKALADLLEDHWDDTVHRSPRWATTRGDHRFDDILEDASAHAVEASRSVRRIFLDRAKEIATNGMPALGSLDGGGLTSRDQITLALFIGELEADVASEVCDMHLWSVSARGNVVTDINRLPEDHPLRTAADVRSLLNRYAAVPNFVDQNLENLRVGLARGPVTNAESLRRTIALVKDQLDQPIERWTLLALDDELAQVADLDAAARTRAKAAAHAAVVEIRKAFQRYHDVLENDVLPAGREGKDIGLGALPIGAACYQARLDNYTGVHLTAAEIHQFGLAEIERIKAEIAQLGQMLFGTADLAATIDTLRTDRSLYFENGPDIVAKAESSLARARAALPQTFGILPKADCRVVEIPAYEARYTTVAYYREPQAGDRPGEYFINTYEPETRPRFEMEVLAYHESIPGHHLQIAIAQEQGELPAFRRFGGSTAFVEGWALYTERLADEMGLYSGDLDRMGMLSYDAWRASRLVVDTGIHAMGWTREEAEQFMLEHTALTPGNIANEVDQYISWPGQAVADKVGQREILQLRDRARAALGPAFSLPEFHDVVLGGGAVTLPVLRQRVDTWLAHRDSSAGAVLPSPVVIGHGAVTELKMDARGRLRALLPWAAELVRFAFEDS